MARPRKPRKAKDKSDAGVKLPDEAAEAIENEHEDVTEEISELAALDGADPGSHVDEDPLEDLKKLDQPVEADGGDGSTPLQGKDESTDSGVIADVETADDPSDHLDEKPVSGIAQETTDADEMSAGEPAGVTSTEEVEASGEDLPHLEPNHMVVETRVEKGSIWPAVFGGAVAALIGFIAGRGDMIDQFLPASMQRPSVDTAAIEAEAAALAENLATQAGQLEALATEVLELEVAEAESTEIVLEAVTALDGNLVSLSERLAVVESTPATTVIQGATTEAVDALQAELSAQNSQLDAQNTQIASQNSQISALMQRAEDAEASAESEAAQLLARAALSRVMVAIDSGEPFGPALSDLEQVSLEQAPGALKEAAATGVPTLATLQDRFPGAARDGLSAARSAVPETEVNGITGFLQRQLKVRSIAPREGSDPDAVLSRAQAAVRNGDLDTALAEMEVLPEEAKTAMSDWLEAASARIAAQDAATELADSLNSN